MSNWLCVIGYGGEALKQERKKFRYIGTRIISGFNLREREVEFLGKLYVVPEHIVPIQFKSRKTGEVTRGIWQVRISKPYRSFNDLNDAINYLKIKIKEHPPKHEIKFKSIEESSKRFQTGAPGIYFQGHEKHNGRCFEIRLNLGIKSSTTSRYLGTLKTVTKESYKDAFVELYVLRKWLEKLTKSREIKWSKNSSNDLDLIQKAIPNDFLSEMSKEALALINYSGFYEYLNSIEIANIRPDSLTNIMQ